MDTNTIEKLKSYKEMLDGGIITEDEFNQLKKQLLDNVGVVSTPVQVPQSMDDEKTEGILVPPEPVVEEPVRAFEPEPVPVPQDQPQGYVAQPQPEPQPQPELQPQGQAYTAAFQADEAKSGGVLSKLTKGAKIGIVAGLVAIVLLIVLLGKGSLSKEESAVIGKWNCSGVYLQGSAYSADSLGLTDDFISFEKNGKFTMNIGSNDHSGTWEYSETRATGGVDYYFYPLTLSSGEKWLALYNTEQQSVILCVQSSIDPDNFILYKK